MGVTISDRIRIEIEIVKGFVAMVRVSSPSIVMSIFPGFLRFTRSLFY